MVVLLALLQSLLLLSHTPLEKHSNHTNSNKSHKFKTQGNRISRDIPRGIGDGVDLTRENTRDVGDGCCNGKSDGSLMVRGHVGGEPSQHDAVEGIDANAAEEHGYVSGCVVGSSESNRVADQDGDGDHEEEHGSLAGTVGEEGHDGDGDGGQDVNGDRKVVGLNGSVSNMR